MLTQIATGVFNPEEPSRYRDLVDSLINFGDHYQVLADYRSYVDCQDNVDELYRQQEKWTAPRCITSPIWGISHQTVLSKNMLKLSGISIPCGYKQSRVAASPDPACAICWPGKRNATGLFFTSRC